MLLTAKDLAPRLQVSTKTIYEWVNDGKIPYVRLPGKGIRFEEKKITTWIENRSIKQYRKAESA